MGLVKNSSQMMIIKKENAYQLDVHVDPWLYVEKDRHIETLDI